MTSHATPTPVTIAPPAGDDDLLRYMTLFDYAFTDSPPATSTVGELRELGAERDALLLRSGEAVIGGAGLIPAGQWFGGQRVPIAAVWGVVIAPEYRSGGHGSQLMREVLGQARERDLALATLYASSQPVYRKLGFEHAAASVRYHLPISLLASMPREATDLAVRELGPNEEPLMRDVYTQWARRGAGLLDRPDVYWTWRLRTENTPVARYVVERNGTPEGYVTFIQLRDGSGNRVIRIRDFVALSGEATRRLLTFLGGHAWTADRIVWWGSPVDPIYLEVVNPGHQIEAHEHVMSRILNLPAALETRGYPRALTAEVHLAVEDDLFPENAGGWRVTIADGRASVTPGGNGRVHARIRGLAPIYTGYYSPFAMRSAGLLDGSDADLSTLAMMFSGPVPWMPDHF